MKQIYLVVKRYLEAYRDANGKQMFPTVRLNTGDYERLRSNVSNKEDNSVDFLTLLSYTNVDMALSTEGIMDGNGILWVSCVYSSTPWLEETVVFDLVDILTSIVYASKSELISSEGTAEEIAARPAKAIDLEMVDFPQSFETIGLLRLGFRVLFTDPYHYTGKDLVTFKPVLTPPFTNVSDVQGDPYWDGKSRIDTNDNAAQFDEDLETP